MSFRFAPNFWGFILSTFLFGTLIAQVIIYAVVNEDGWRLRSCVVALLSLVTVSFSLASYSTYVFTIPNYSSTVYASGYTAYSDVNTEVGYMVAAVVQLYFARQVYYINNRNRLIAFTIVGLSLVALVFGFVVCALNFIHLHAGAVPTGGYRVLILMPGTFSAISDTISAVAMCGGLWRFNGSMNYRRTDRLIKFLLVSTLNRGVLVTFAQIAWVLMYIIAQRRLVWYPLFVCLPGIYANTCLFMLNWRTCVQTIYFGKDPSELQEKPNTQPPHGPLRSKLNEGSASHA